MKTNFSCARFFLHFFSAMANIACSGFIQWIVGVCMLKLFSKLFAHQNLLKWCGHSCYFNSSTHNFYLVFYLRIIGNGSGEEQFPSCGNDCKFRAWTCFGCERNFLSNNAVFSNYAIDIKRTMQIYKSKWCSFWFVELFASILSKKSNFRWHFWFSYDYDGPLLLFNK